MTSEKIQHILAQHVNPPAIPYCIMLWKNNPFHLKISRTRHTKAGDFFCSRATDKTRITINKELNPYLFLMTYIHEVAHLHVFRNYSSKIDPHGREWKTNFQQLMKPVLTTAYFPDEILTVLKKHMLNPKASSFSDASLTKAFRLFDPHLQESVTVGELVDGARFVLRGKYFVKGPMRRTRCLCEEVKSKRKYLVPAEALVSEVQLTMF